MHASRFSALAFGWAVAFTSSGHGDEQVPASLREATARLNYAGSGVRYNCTATLVSPHAALTGWGCISGVDAGQIHLLTSFDRGQYGQHLRVREAILEDPASGLALLCLASPADGTTVFAPVLAPSVSLAVQISGHWGPKDQILNTESCEIDSVDPSQRTFRAGCAVGPGAAGSPVYSAAADGGKLIGIVVAASDQFVVAAPWDGPERAQPCAP